MAVSTAIRVWTLDDLHSMPDDGNTYELLYGELFVTPAPSLQHQEIIARLLALLVPHVTANQLGLVHTARSIIRKQGNEVEPDVFIPGPASHTARNWDEAPVPLLVVEVLSPFSRRRDLEKKRRFYVDDLRIAEYWVVDPDTHTLRVMRPALADVIIRDEWVWHAPGTSEPLTLDVHYLFGDVTPD